MEKESSKKESVAEMLIKTHDKHLGSSPIEAGELAQEIGKKTYLPELRKVIENHRSYNKPILWFPVHQKKSSQNLRVVEIRIAAVDENRVPRKLIADLDLWRYDYRKEELLLLWSVPHASDFEDFLSNPDQYDDLLIKWIKQYMKQEGMSPKNVSWDKYF